MAFSISKNQLMAARGQAERMLARARNITEKSEEAVGQVIRTAEVGGAAFAAGLAKGRWGTVEVMGIPADLLAATGLHGLGFVGGGRYKEHLHSLGDGVLASYATTLGAGIGDRMAREAAAAAAAQAAPAAAPAARASGESGHELSSGAERLSDAELQALQAAGLRR